MAVVTGGRRTDTVASDQRYIDIAKPILLLEPSAAPLTVITKSLSSKPAGDPKFKWVEDERDTRFDSINKGSGEYEANATELVVANGELFYVGALVIAGAAFAGAALGDNAEAAQNAKLKKDMHTVIVGYQAVNGQLSAVQKACKDIMADPSAADYADSGTQTVCDAANYQ